MTRTLALFGIVLFATCSAGAQTVLHYREGQRVEPEQVMRILDRDGGAPRTRSIRLLDSGAAASGAAAAAAHTAPSALSLPVRFAFDSSDILPSAREQLDALAAGIRLLPPGRSIVIAGHTDATGTEEYNLALSARRAATVKRYLVESHGIEPQRLKVAGLGEREPIAGTSPYAAENRRVQFQGS